MHVCFVQNWQTPEKEIVGCQRSFSCKNHKQSFIILQNVWFNIITEMVAWIMLHPAIFSISSIIQVWVSRISEFQKIKPEKTNSGSKVTLDLPCWIVEVEIIYIYVWCKIDKPQKKKLLAAKGLLVARTTDSLGV